MRPIPIHPSTRLSEEEDLAAFGGRYGFIDSLLMGGTGSPKMIYVSGSDHFDQLARDIYLTHLNLRHIY